MFEDVQDHEKGEFNSGLAIVYRLDGIHKYLHLAKFKRDHESYYWGLVAYFVELSRMMKPKTGELLEHKGYWDEVKSDFFKIVDLIKRKQPVPHSLYESFVMWEVELTIIEQKYNVGMPTKGDPRWAMASGR